MKRIFYSKVTKFLAWILILALIVPAFDSFIDGLQDYVEMGGDAVYAFGKDFESSYYVSSLLNTPLNALGFSYMDMRDVSQVYTRNGDGSVEVELYEYAQPTPTSAPVPMQTVPPMATVSPSTTPPVDEESARDEAYYSSLEKRIRRFADDERIEYYISVNDKVYTNCGAKSENELMDREFYYFVHRSPNGDTKSMWAGAKGRLATMEDYVFGNERIGDDEIIVCTAIVDSHADEMRRVWYEQEQIVKECFTELLVLFGAMLVLMLYLFFTAGKTAQGLDARGFMDKVWTEIYLLVAGLAAFGGAFTVVVILDSYFETYYASSYYGGIPDYIAAPTVYIVTALTVIFTFGSLIMCIRKLRQGKFLKDCLCWGAIVFCWKLAKKILGWAWNMFKYICSGCRSVITGLRRSLRDALGKKSGRYMLGILTAYSALMWLCGILTLEAGIFLIFAMAAFGAAVYFVLKRARELDSIRTGAAIIRRGQLSHKIEEPKSADLVSLAADINHIAQGLDESVAAKLKAEKLKTELITNVSHDLKTPLTSIISYTELLSKVEGLPEEAQDYIRIIDGKSQRLKNLTQDLFDISKVQSGSEKISFEKLDAALLIAQSLAEHDNEIKASGLNFIVSTDKELYFLADGKKMSRVVGNLVENILKYSLSGTRVFISASERDGKIVMEFKNIASYLMDFDAEEILARFVRGDESRSTDGNGLGLAIAKSYVEACRGSFDVTIDGDLFKATISFDKA